MSLLNSMNNILVIESLENSDWMQAVSRSIFGNPVFREDDYLGKYVLPSCSGLSEFTISNSIIHI